MELLVYLESLEKIVAESWIGKVALGLIGHGHESEVVLQGYTDGLGREATVAKLKELLCATVKLLQFLDPDAEVGMVEVECETCQDRRYYPIVVQDLFDRVKGVEGAA